jgi:hypothetical protein
MDVTTTIMSSNRPPKKPPPPDPQRSGKPVPKGKGRAKAPTPEVDDQADQTWQGMTFSEDKTPVYEGKKKRKQQLAEEAEEEMSRETVDNHAKKEVWATTHQADPSMEEINRFLSYHNDVNMDIDTEVNSQNIKTSEASRPTSLWSASSEQFLCPPHDEGHSSGAEVPPHSGAPASPALLVVGVETPSRLGHHPANIVNPPLMRKIGSSKRRSSVCATTSMKIK